RTIIFTQYTTEGLVQQRFAKMARYVVNSRLSFARNFILAENNRLRSSPLMQAAKRCAKYKATNRN
ncbi:hypothetical protein, partial [Flavobacterium sp. ACAM 123]|uniref:hypothetical protein n=1 Tax=Flavobacterium sp. ACAM 123 TaxID=1189620 RepID=UPI00055101A2